jgi:hypothetical protein
MKMNFLEFFVITHNLRTKSILFCILLHEILRNFKNEKERYKHTQVNSLRLVDLIEFFEADELVWGKVNLSG